MQAEFELSLGLGLAEELSDRDVDSLRVGNRRHVAHGRELYDLHTWENGEKCTCHCVRRFGRSFAEQCLAGSKHCIADAIRTVRGRALCVYHGEQGWFVNRQGSNTTGICQGSISATAAP